MNSSSESTTHKVVWIVILSALVQVLIAFLPDTMGDLISYRDWTQAVVRQGIVHAYLESDFLRDRGTAIIYPPVIPLIYWTAGHALTAINESLLSNRYFLEVFLKSIGVLFNLLILWILWLGNRRHDYKIVAATLVGYSLNPAIIFNTSYWGQTDSISSFLILTALYLQKNFRKPEFSAVLAATAVMAKPTIWPIALLVAVAVLKRNGIRRFATAGMAAAATFCALLLPFIFEGRFKDVIQALVTQIDASPYVSANAHNLWWIVQGGLPMIQVDTHLIGPFSYKEVGILLSGSFIAITIWKFWQSDSSEALYLAAASIAFGFFMLSTHMHENHWFMMFPVFAMIAFRKPLFKKLFYILSGVFLANLLLHDPYLNYLIHDSVPGPSMDLRSQPADSPIARTFEQEGKAYVLQERTGKITIVGYFLTLLNAQAALIVFLIWLIYFYRTKSFDPVLEDQITARPAVLRSAIAIVLFVALTSLQFMMKASRFL
jgi:Gpi18-like mannosyltransferase